jgi:hypothetical protein
MSRACSADNVGGVEVLGNSSPWKRYTVASDAADVVAMSAGSSKLLVILMMVVEELVVVVKLEAW